jgi:hypothetical protein
LDESLSHIGFPGYLRIQYFEGDLLIQYRMSSQIDFAHPALTQLTINDIVKYAVSGLHEIEPYY